MVSPARREELIHLGLRIVLALLIPPVLFLPSTLGVLAQQHRMASPGQQPRLNELPQVASRPRLGAIATRNLFRADRRPSGRPYSDAPPMTAISDAAPRPPKPAIAVTGLVGGSRPAAVLEGLPGLEGARVVAVGDSAGGVRVIRITGSTIVLRGFDTLWTLGVRRPW